MTDELKPLPCPCCNSPAHFHIEGGFTLGRVICDNINCGLKTQLTVEPNAVALWNRRVEPGNCVKMSVRDEVLDFATAMEVTLKLNDHKCGWKNESIEYLISKLENEVTELKYALDFALYPEEKQGECVDVANFAMMLFDVLSLKRGEGE